MVRMGRNARAESAAVRQAIRSLDPNVPVARIGTMAGAISQSVSLFHFRSLFMTVFAATASCSPRSASMEWSPTSWRNVRRGNRVADGARRHAFRRGCDGRSPGVEDRLWPASRAG